jgi:hypothetical protein
MRARELPILVVFLARNCLAGIATGWAILGAMLYFDIASLGALMFGSDMWLPALILTGAGFGGTFGSLAMGTAIFLLPKR